MNKTIERGSADSRAELLHDIPMRISGLDSLPLGWRFHVEAGLSDLAVTGNVEPSPLVRVEFSGRRAAILAPEETPVLVAAQIHACVNRLLSELDKVCCACGAQALDARIGSGAPSCAEHREHAEQHPARDELVHIFYAPQSFTEPEPARHEPTTSAPAEDLAGRDGHGISDVRTTRIYAPTEMTAALRAIRFAGDKGRADDLERKMQRHGGVLRYAGVPQHIDTAGICADLSTEMPNFALVIEQVLRPALIRARLTGRLVLPRVLVRGEPGSGKSRLWRRLAELLELPFTLIDMSTIDMAGAIVGSDARWGNSREGEIFRLLTGGCGFPPVANPLVIVEEIDKATDGHQFPVTPALLTLLEPSTASRFEDRSVPGVYLDASAINWVFTANWVERIPSPLLSRCVDYEIDPLNSAQRRIAAHTVVREIVGAWRIDHIEFDDVIDEPTERVLAIQPLRQMRQCVDLAVSRALEAGRRRLEAADIVPMGAERERRAIGFY